MRGDARNTPEEAFRDTALVIIDLQNDFCAPGGAAVAYAESQDDLEQAVKNTGYLVRAARSAGAPCVFVRSLMDSKYKLPRLLARHQKLGLEQEICREGTWGAEFYQLEPARHECTVTKHTNDAFLYTYLEPLLRKYQARTVLVCGVYTELCVEDTVRSALQRGFHVAVPEDCTAGLSRTCARVSLDTMRAYDVDVTSLPALVPGVNTAAGAPMSDTTPLSVVVAG